LSGLEQSRDVIGGHFPTQSNEGRERIKDGDTGGAILAVIAGECFFSFIVPLAQL
jgi:hypothetical protein